MNSPQRRVILVVHTEILALAQIGQFRQMIKTASTVETHPSDQNSRAGTGIAALRQRCGPSKFFQQRCCLIFLQGNSLDCISTHSTGKTVK
ncbi:unnamed protein product [Protopolystoma xenopodis]|uniref:Uncharacterized protein n=1 Tax=Protopolystoma xenopodis TaxID=117903 RepID=A0A448WAW0_9PLAT|nr:unnamed protein product [Protopolystoma xenopodis]